MLVTLFTDGSHNHHNGAGGWAVWVESSKGRLVHYGTCPSDLVECSNHAELFAIHMGLQLALREWGSEIHAFRICADSESALRHARKGPLRSRVRDRSMMKIRGWIQDLYKRARVQVLVEHVKGHQDPSLGHEFAMNNNVDRLATKGRKSMSGSGYIKVREAMKISEEAQGV